MANPILSSLMGKLLMQDMKEKKDVDDYKSHLLLPEIASPRTDGYESTSPRSSDGTKLPELTPRSKTNTSKQMSSGLATLTGFDTFNFNPEDLLDDDDEYDDDSDFEDCDVVYSDPKQAELDDLLRKLEVERNDLNQELRTLKIECKGKKGELKELGSKLKSALQEEGLLDEGDQVRMKAVRKNPKLQWIFQHKLDKKKEVDALNRIIREKTRYVMDLEVKITKNKKLFKELTKKENTSALFACSENLPLDPYYSLSASSPERSQRGLDQHRRPTIQLGDLRESIKKLTWAVNAFEKQKKKYKEASRVLKHNTGEYISGSDSEEELEVKVENRKKKLKAAEEKMNKWRDKVKEQMTSMLQGGKTCSESCDLISEGQDLVDRVEHFAKKDKKKKKKKKRKHEKKKKRRSHDE